MPADTVGRDRRASDGGETSREEAAIEADGAADPEVREAADDQALVSASHRIRAVLRVRDFRRLWLVMSFSSFGDWLGLLATTALAAELNANGYAAANFALGGVLVVRLLPAVVFGPLAGAFADRFDRRKLMVAADVGRFALFLSIPLVGALWWLFVATFLVECISLFWIPAKEASVPNLVRKDQLESANQVSLVTTYGITPVVAALVFSLLALLTRVLADRFEFFNANRVDLALYINSATFLASALTVLRIRRISGRSVGTSPPTEGVLRLVIQGWEFIGQTRLVRGLVIGILGAFAAGGAVIGTGKTYAASLGGGDATYGILFGAVFVGLGLGMGLGPRVARDLSRRRLFGLSIIFAGVCLVLVALMPHLLLSLVFVIGVGFGAGTAYLSGITLLGREVADEVRGRTFAFVQSLVRVDLILTLAAAPFVVGLLRQRTVDAGVVDFTVDGTRILLVLAGLLAVVGGIVSYRQMDDRAGVPVVPDLVSALRHDTRMRRRLSKGGMLIAFEGGEGSGKSTQAARLAEWLSERGVAVTVTHEPGATDFGVRVRQILLDSPDGSLTPRAEALLFAADRAHHVDTVIRPALDRGDVVITDRYVDSSLAYQGAGRALADGRHPPAVPVGDRWAPPRPHRAARHRPGGRARAGAGGRSRAGPGRAGVAGVPPAGSGRLPGPRRLGAGPLPRDRRGRPPRDGGHADPHRDRQAARQPARRPAPASAAGRGRKPPRWRARRSRSGRGATVATGPPAASPVPPVGTASVETPSDEVSETAR